MGILTEIDLWIDKTILKGIQILSLFWIQNVKKILSNGKIQTSIALLRKTSEILRNNAIHKSNWKQ